MTCDGRVNCKSLDNKCSLGCRIWVTKEKCVTKDLNKFFNHETILTVFRMRLMVMMLEHHTNCQMIGITFVSLLTVVEGNVANHLWI